nr:hypothetical protein [Kibdelosporangium sp. MJ126-NF4]
MVPYITSWSEEDDPLDAALLLEHGGRLAYLNETLTDRDAKGVLWCRTFFRPRQGKPNFGVVHPLRQRRAMLRLLCQVCGSPATRSDNGILWLLKDHRDDWPNWPADMAVTEPPICMACAKVASRLCPALRPGAVLLWARTFPVVGVYGPVYRSTGVVRVVSSEEQRIVTYGDPAIRWVCATSQIRRLNDCTIVSMDTL